MIPCQRAHDGKLLFIAKDVPSKGWKSFYFRAPTGVGKGSCTAAIENPIRIGTDMIENDRIAVRFDEKMHIVSLLDKISGRELIPKGQVGHRLMAYEDRPARDDAWNVQAYHTEKGTEIDQVLSAEVLESGPVRGLIRVHYRFRSSDLYMDISVTQGSPLLDFHYEIDWHEHHYFVKAEYPVHVNATRATYDIQFGYLERSITTNTLWDFGHFEACAHKYADLSDAGHGLAILNDCKYGYSASRNLLAISLLKCATYPDPMQDQGHHTFSYALYAHEGDQAAAHVRALAYEYNDPVRAVFSPRKSGTLPDRFSLFKLSASNIILETVKKAEDSDDWILRLYESENKDCTVTLSVNAGVTAAAECDLMENEEDELPVISAVQNGIPGVDITLSFRPFEIKTVRLSVDH